ncbi:MAG: helix-turn-helix domain-containing protein [Lentisphaerae bacterium]|nr:helix-turn-helix domain-containing protein [Lentisphaerota bacterium]
MMRMIPCFTYTNDFHLFPVATNHFTGGQHPVRQWHKHVFSELVFILGGQAVHICDDRESPVSTGDVLLIPPGAVHAYDHDRKSLELFNVLYDANRIIMPRLDIHRYSLFQKMFPESLQAVKELSYAEPILHLEPDKMQNIRNILDNMAAESESRYIGHVFATMNCFMQLLLMLCRYSHAVDSPVAGNEVFSRAIKYIHKHYTENINIRDIAVHARCSVRNLYRFFAQSAGCTPKEYMMQLRLSKASNLLLNSQLNISEIAFACGFNDGNYFSKKFHDMTGTTPGNFRKNPEQFYDHQML